MESGGGKRPEPRGLTSEIQSLLDSVELKLRGCNAAALRWTLRPAPLVAYSSSPTAVSASARSRYTSQRAILPSRMV